MTKDTERHDQSMEACVDRFPRPDWSRLWESLALLSSDEERQTTWLQRGHEWLTDTAAVLGRDFIVHEVGDFWIVANQSTDEVQRLSQLLHDSRRRITAELDGIAADPLFSRLAVLWLEDSGQYYEYVAHFYPESGEFGLSGGMFLRGGYPHFVFPHYQEIGQLEHVVAHELTHALTSHLSLPLWVDEGMAVTLEEMIAGGTVFRSDPEMLDQHRRFWDAGTIQEFWCGASFSRSDEGHDLSYALAQLLVVNLGHDYAKYRQFALCANCDDAGEAAAHQTFGISLGDLIAAFLGAGDWAPQPARWGRLGRLPPSDL
jgi:hypothetical protein